MKRHFGLGRPQLRLTLLLSTCLGSFGWGTAAQAAEQVVFAYGPLSRAVPVRAIAAYAREGRITPELEPYADLLASEQLAQIRVALTSAAPSNLAGVVAVSQFLYTPEGEAFLEQVGSVVRTSPQLPGALAIRGALIRSAADPSGINLVNFLRYYPTPTVYIDLRQGVQFARRIQRLVRRTQQVAAQAGSGMGDGVGIDFSQLPDLRETGAFTVEEYRLDLRNPQGDRPLPTDLYLPRVVPLVPRSPTAVPVVRPNPIVVISHGLGEDRASFRYIALQLASYGYVVAVPEHSGSSDQRLRNVLAGLENAVVDPQEFVDRPRDISFLLDELTRLNQTDPRLRGRLDPEHVGVFGHSFGGYTALALAGADLDLAGLRQSCANQPTLLANPSIVLQCRAVELPGQRLSFRDPRVRAAVAVSPLTSLIFGASGLRAVKAPVTIVTGTNDAATPALAEHLRPFAFLPQPKYLVTLTGATHFSFNDPGSSGVFTLPAAVVGPAPNLARQYLQALVVAFFNTTVSQELDFGPYLSPEYTRFLSQQALPVQLSQQAPAEVSSLHKPSPSSVGLNQ
ncbi:alpha/beta hydrolase [Leptolyngbya sp. FACHB-261]|uniref:alpha/beta hydrolase n=1 Tax=Leptolyngbya sp. FACHB-261 TaxID=2692806 RepID=UPI001685CD76|nr:alpha/beta hydrolase [Leptolyngbya sp. FACHB-261]MBD2102279.1 alpha/beta hydrolase [Leptolyngbya sp. FACHB-261]